MVIFMLFFAKYQFAPACRKLVVSFSWAYAQAPKNSRSSVTNAPPWTLKPQFESLSALGAPVAHRSWPMTLKPPNLACASAVRANGLP